MEAERLKQYGAFVKSLYTYATVWYVDLVVSIEVPVKVCCCFTVFSC
jgi:hypothetical protein